VQVRTGSRVRHIDAESVIIEMADGVEESIATHTVLWAAGMRTTPLQTGWHKRSEPSRTSKVASSSTSS
jgi:NADH dehydrogenase FAD-containing subunit